MKNTDVFRSLVSTSKHNLMQIHLKKKNKKSISSRCLSLSRIGDCGDLQFTDVHIDVRILLVAS